MQALLGKLVKSFASSPQKLAGGTGLSLEVQSLNPIARKQVKNSICIPIHNLFVIPYSFPFHEFGRSIPGGVRRTFAPYRTSEVLCLRIIKTIPCQEQKMGQPFYAGIQRLNFPETWDCCTQTARNPASIGMHFAKVAQIRIG